MFYPTPRRGEHQTELGQSISLRAMLLYGLLITSAGLPIIGYVLTRRLNTLATPPAPTYSDTLGHTLYQTVGEKWLINGCQTNLTLRWPKNVMIVFPGQQENTLVGFDKNGNKTAVSVQGLSGEFKTCSLQRLK